MFRKLDLCFGCLDTHENEEQMEMGVSKFWRKWCKYFNI